jgi:hypothetical protein
MPSLVQIGVSLLDLEVNIHTDIGPHTNPQFQLFVQRSQGEAVTQTSCDMLHCRKQTERDMFIFFFS